jgi:hypothetical protein
MSPERWTAEKTRFEGNLDWCEDGPVQFDAGALPLCTQPFDGAYVDEAPRFRALPPSGTTISALSMPGTMEGAVTDAGSFHFKLHDDRLTVTGRFVGKVQAEPTDLPVWKRPRLEICLKPFSDRTAMVQFGVAADGEKAVVWHGGEVSEALEWTATAERGEREWSILLTVPLDAVETRLRAICGAADEEVSDWRGLAGVTLPALPGDFDAWQAHSGDHAGIIADPGFANPKAGDFSLPPDSPAFSLGFQPFDCPSALKGDSRLRCDRGRPSVAAFHGHLPCRGGTIP